MVLLAGLALSALPTPATWPVGDSLGGVLGTLLLGHGVRLVTLEAWILAALAAALSAGMLVYILGIAREDLRALRRALSWTLGQTGGLGRTGSGLYAFARRQAQAAMALRAALRERGQRMRREPRLGRAAALYLLQEPWEGPCRFDVLGMTGSEEGWRYELVENAFELA